MQVADDGHEACLGKMTGGITYAGMVYELLNVDSNCSEALVDVAVRCIQLDICMMSHPKNY